MKENWKHLHLSDRDKDTFFKRRKRFMRYIQVPQINQNY